MKNPYILLILLAVLLLGAKPKISNQVIEIGYSYALMDASTTAMNECFIFGDDSLRCKGATQVVLQLNYTLDDMRLWIDIDEGRWP